MTRRGKSGATELEETTFRGPEALGKFLQLPENSTILGVIYQDHEQQAILLRLALPNNPRVYQRIGLEIARVMADAAVRIRERLTH